MAGRANLALMANLTGGTGDIALAPVANWPEFTTEFGAGTTTVRYVARATGYFERGDAPFNGTTKALARSAGTVAESWKTGDATMGTAKLDLPATGVTIFCAIGAEEIDAIEAAIDVLEADMASVDAALAALVIGTTVQAHSDQLDDLATSDLTGTGAIVREDSPTLIDPALGTPVSGDLSNCTAIPGPQIIGLIAVANLATGTPTGSKFIRDDGVFATPAGAGDVAKVGTPANNQLGVWTGDGTIEGDAALTFDTSTDTLAIGASGNLAFGAVTVIDDAAGVTTLANIDAIDATTEATLVAALELDDLGDAEVAEVNAGTATDIAVTPDSLAGSYAGTGAFEYIFGCDEDYTPTPITTGDGKGGKFRVPGKLNGHNVVSITVYHETAGVTGTSLYQLRRVRSGAAVDILTNRAMIDSGETSSADGATPVSINTSNDDLATGDLVWLDIDQVSSGTPPTGGTAVVETRLP